MNDQIILCISNIIVDNVALRGYLERIALVADICTCRNVMHEERACARERKKEIVLWMAQEVSFTQGVTQRAQVHRYLPAVHIQNLPHKFT